MDYKRFDGDVRHVVRQVDLVRPEPFELFDFTSHDYGHLRRFRIFRFRGTKSRTAIPKIGEFRYSVFVATTRPNESLRLNLTKMFFILSFLVFNYFLLGQIKRLFATPRLQHYCCRNMLTNYQVEHSHTRK